MKQNKTSKILLADDISSDPDQKIRAQAARTYAVALAKGLGKTIDLVHVEDLTLFPGTTSYYRSFLTQFFAERKAALKQVVHTIEAPVKPVFIEGSPSKTLLKLASKRGAYEL